MLTVTDKDRGWAALKRDLAKAGGDGIYGKAGIIGAKGGAEHAAKDGEEPLTNAELALIHEFGIGVPERSFLRAAFDQNQPKYIENLQKLVVAIYDGKIGIVRALGLLSQQAASDIRNFIRDDANGLTPNSPITIARKGSSKPLIDTAQLINAISGAVEQGRVAA